MIRPIFLILAAFAWTLNAQEARAPWDASLVYPVRDASYANIQGSMVAILDLDGDGVQDVAAQARTGSATAGVPGTAWFFTQRNLGDGTFVLGPYRFDVSGANPLSDRPRTAVGRIGPDDGKDDLVGAYANTFRGAVSTASGTPGQIGPIVMGAAIRGLQVRDFDLDGGGDIAVLTLGAVSVFRVVGATSLVPATVALPPGHVGRDLAVVEATGDAFPDLVVLTSAGVLVFPYTPAGIGTPITHLLPMVPDHVIPGDVDGDGDQDLSCFSMTGNASVLGGVTGAYVLLRRTGPAVFAQELPLTGGPASHLYDVDGDGDLDGVCCGGGGSVFVDPIPDLPSFFRISLNDGAGNFAPAFEIPSYGAYHLAGVADMDGDGDQDLVGGKTIYFARGGNLTGPVHAPAPTASLHPSGCVDVEGDGDTDLGLGAIPWWNLGDGVSGATQVPAIRGLPTNLSLPVPGYPADWDGDGDPDLVVEAWSNGSALELRLLENRGGTFFDGGRAFPVGVTATPYIGVGSDRVQARDADGDGDLDFLASTGTTYGGFTHIWWNNGNGTFGSVTALEPHKVVEVADFTNDGIPDLLVSDGNLLLRRGLGGHGFANPELLTYASWFTGPGSFRSDRDGLAVADFDGDGDLDVAAAERPNLSSAPSHIVFLWNRTYLPGTQGTTALFDPISLLSAEAQTGIGTSKLLARDVDADGRLDLVFSPARMAPVGGTGVLFARGTGTNTFSAADATVVAGTGLAEIADMDGDGDGDLIGPDFIARGTLFHGSAAGSILQFAPGLAGSDQIVPSLGSAAPLRVGQTSRTKIVGGLGGAQGLLGLGLAAAQVPAYGGTLSVDPLIYLPVTLDGFLGASGSGSAIIDQGVIPPAFAGVELYLQAGFLDAGAVQGVSLTNAVRVRIGN